MFDADDIEQLRGRLELALEELRKRTNAVGTARQIANDKFAEVRLKAIKAKYYLAQRKQGCSQGDADEYARTEEGYTQEVEQEAANYKRARELIAEWEYFMALVDTNRSLLAIARQSMGMM